jgi:hypothetical protein
MFRASMLALCLSLAPSAFAAEPLPVPPALPAPPVPVAQIAAPGLPPMHFVSSLAEDELYTLFKAAPGFSTLDDELYGSPLKLVVTHTSRPTAGGQAAGLLSAVISGSTLGIIPMVTNDHLVVRYEVMLNGKTVTSYSFERTATRAINIWGGGGDYGLGKAGLEWVKSTATEAAGKLANDPAVAALQREIAFYFPESASAKDAPAPAPPAPPAAPAASSR